MDEQSTDQSTIDSEKNQIVKLLGLANPSNIVLNETGWTSRVYIIDSGGFVFKFPRYEKVKEEYEVETIAYTIAASLDSDVSVPILSFKDPNFKFIAYEGVIGDTLDRVTKLSTKEQRQIGVRMGGFLKQLHASEWPLDTGLDLEAEIGEFQEKYKLGLSEIEKELSNNEQKKLRELVEIVYPRESRKLGADSGFCHGDLGYWNIVYRGKGKIGIIDFGDAGIYDKSKDFIGIEDGALLEAVLTEYGASDVLREKIKLRRRLLPILDLPFFIGKKDKAGVARTINRIRVSNKAYFN